VSGICGAVGFVNVVPDVSGPGARARGRVKCSVRCVGMIRFCFHLGLGSDVSYTA